MISSSLSQGTTSSATKTGWRVWVALVIAPLLLAALIAAFYAYLGMLSFGTSQTTDLQVNRALPYILMFNHTLLFLLIVWLLYGEGLVFECRL